jgi:hypothetical protein
MEHVVDLDFDFWINLLAFGQWEDKFVPSGYQKIPYHIVFDVKYDLRHKARLVAGGNWTENEK